MQENEFRSMSSLLLFFLKIADAGASTHTQAQLHVLLPLCLQDSIDISRFRPSCCRVLFVCLSHPHITPQTFNSISHAQARALNVYLHADQVIQLGLDSADPHFPLARKPAHKRPRTWTTVQRPSTSSSFQPHATIPANSSLCRSQFPMWAFDVVAADRQRA